MAQTWQDGQTMSKLPYGPDRVAVCEGARVAAGKRGRVCHIALALMVGGGGGGGAVEARGSGANANANVS